MAMSWIQAFATPASIPADGVELLRHLVSTPGTREQALEDWIRTYPQVFGSTPDGLFPKQRFRLPGEPGRYWEPDILYRQLGNRNYDIIELKRADIPLIASGSVPGLTRWKPSSPPTFSRQMVKAMSQLRIYMLYAHDFSEFLEREHNLQIYLPRGMIIAGNEVDLSSERDLRLLTDTLPNKISFLTWGAVLARAEQLQAYKVVISLPCTFAPDTPPSPGDFDLGIHRRVSSAFYDWTGFSSPYVDPLQNWETLLQEAHGKIAAYEQQHDIHANDEEWNAYSRFRGSTLEEIYYRLGKYCLDRKEYRKLRAALPALDQFVDRRTFVKLGDRLQYGFEDAQAFIQKGRSIRSVAELETAIDEVLKTRGSYREPDPYYVKMITSGYLRKRVVDSELRALLATAGWIQAPPAWHR